MKTFSMSHLFFESDEPEVFTEINPPEWLTGGDFKNFWYNNVLKLKVGESIKTDFRCITRVICGVNPVS